MEKELELTIELKDKKLEQELCDLVQENSRIKIIEPKENEIPNYLITDIPHLKKMEQEFLSEHAEKIILLSDKEDEINVTKYLDKYSINHLVGVTGNNVALEINVLLNKISTNNIWGLRPYLNDNTRIMQEGVENTHSLNDMISRNLSQLDFSQYFSTPLDYLSLIANELLTNALYNGIAHRDSLNPRKEISRKEDVFLKGSELVLFSTGADQSAIGISVQDSFGKLDRAKIVSGLARSFNEKKAIEKEGGAGLGFYVIFNHCNQLVINFKRNSRTEVMAIIDHNRRYKKYKERITSFHFYEEVAK